MKKRTLNQTWTLCLRMWRSVSEKWAENKRRSVDKLKRTWLKENGFKWKRLISDCFFCGYNNEDDNCDSCPGKLIDSSFSCCRGAYHYRCKPVAFYKELLRLHRIRKAKK